VEYMKHTLVDALNQKTCPVCHIVKQREEKAFWWFFTENYHDSEVLEDLIDTSFFCDYHANTLENNDHGPLSFIFQIMVQSDTQKLKNLKGLLEKTMVNGQQGFLGGMFNPKSRTRSGKTIDGVFRGYTSCRFCRMNENTSRYIEEILEELIRKDTAFRELYRKSYGLCRRHLIDILKLSNDGACSEFLVDDMLSRLKVMHDNFELYFHKLDYRYSHEPKGEEQNTWLDALNFYSSSKRSSGKPSAT